MQLYIIGYNSLFLIKSRVSIFIYFQRDSILSSLSLDASIYIHMQLSICIANNYFSIRLTSPNSTVFLYVCRVFIHDKTVTMKDLPTLGRRIPNFEQGMSNFEVGAWRAMPLQFTFVICHSISVLRSTAKDEFDILFFPDNINRILCKTEETR